MAVSTTVYTPDMLVYRLARTKWSDDLSGEGARLHGGRWNQTGIPCIYASESRALALLEYTVNVGIDEIPRALSMITLEIPDKKIYSAAISEIPGNWRDSPAPASTRDFGTELLKSHLIIQLPSAVLPEENNFLINPLHKDIQWVKIISKTDFVYDLRIKTSIVKRQA
ncbi:MAG: RES family NAD+ phosphorylase [Flavisolibacter sp.]